MSRGPLLLAGTILAVARWFAFPPAPEKQPFPAWETGFWFWQGSSTTASAAFEERLDVLYFQAGTIPATRAASLPDSLPAAKAYWAVFRFDDRNLPGTESIPVLAAKIKDLAAEAIERRINLVGVQLDVDSPAARLPDYARYLRAVRAGLPDGMQLSITGLLDWFREGTAVAQAVDAVDEFVPQFYDVHDPGRLLEKPGIAARIDAVKWGPRFNAFGKRYRIGVSTFGRSRFFASGSVRATEYRDLRPADLASEDGALQLETSTTDAGEMLARYRATRAGRFGYGGTYEAGSVFEFILATPSSVHRAVEQAKRMGGYCGGVVFFRWPTAGEALAMGPGEVLDAVGNRAEAYAMPELETVHEPCPMGRCTDLILKNVPILREKPLRILIETSRELEYFLPSALMPARMAGARRLEVTVPPFSGRNALHLGRAVSVAEVAYRIREVKP